MKYETILNALTNVSVNYVRELSCKSPRRRRQYHRFRDWLIRRDEQQQSEIRRLKREVVSRYVP